MTDPTTPTDDDLSLALDGEADAELLARIDASPEAQARLEELRSAADLVARPVPPLDDDAVTSLVDTALATPVAPPRVAARTRGRATPWIVAASVVLLMAAGLTLVWAGRGTDDDQASASKTALLEEQASDGAADSAFGQGSAESTGAAPGGHGTPTTVAQASTADLPVVYLGAYESPDRLREATATSFADALKASTSRLSYDGTDTGTDTDPQSEEAARAMAAPPAAKSVDRCADQLQVTLSLKDAPLQEGYATVDGQTVLVYEFPATSARSGKETTLVAAVGVDACDEVVLFER